MVLPQLSRSLDLSLLILEPQVLGSFVHMLVFLDVQQSLDPFVDFANVLGVVDLMVDMVIEVRL